MERQFLSSRKSGIITIGSFYLLQTAYAIFPCGGNVLGLWLGTTIILFPAFVALAIGSMAATAGACVGLLPFVIWANHVECVVPYAGGGAPMGYVVVILFGVPTSAAVALLAGWLAHACAGRSRPKAGGEI